MALFGEIGPADIRFGDVRFLEVGFTEVHFAVSQGNYPIEDFSRHGLQGAQDLLRFGDLDGLLGVEDFGVAGN